MALRSSGFSTISSSGFPRLSGNNVSGAQYGSNTGSLSSFGSAKPVTSATEKKEQQTVATTQQQNTATQDIAKRIENVIGNTQGNSLAVTRQTERETGDIVTDQMDPATRATFNSILATLQGGGSATQQAGLSGITSEQQRAAGLAGQYGIDAARTQARQSMDMYAARLSEEIMPVLLNSAAAAGMSGDALTALLANDAAARVSRQAADAELGAILAYGQLQQGQQQLSLGAAGQLANDPVMASMLAALGIGKGSMTTENRNITRTTDGTVGTSTSETTTQSGDSSTTGSTTQTGTTTGSSNTAGTSADQDYSARDVAAIDALNTNSDIERLAAIEELLNSGGRSLLDMQIGGAAGGTKASSLSSKPKDIEAILSKLGLGGVIS